MPDKPVEFTAGICDGEPTRQGLAFHKDAFVLVWPPPPCQHPNAQLTDGVWCCLECGDRTKATDA